MSRRPIAVERWHRLVATRDPSQLQDFLADDVVFRSPAVHSPQEGRAKAGAYLHAALEVLGPSLAYHREWASGRSAVLEFTATIDGKETHGIDLIVWDETDRVVEFTVMVRPVQGLQVLIARMGEELQRQTR